MVEYLVTQMPCVNNMQNLVLLQTFIPKLFIPSGLGRTAPDPSAAVTLDGVQVPLGKGVHTNIDDTSLLYNEYPLTLTTRCMNLIIFLPNDPTFSLLCYIINHLIVCRKVQVRDLVSTYWSCY